MDKYIIAPITEEVTANLKSGDFVYLSGTVYSARDAAHKRLAEAIEKGEDLPFDLKDSVVYYMGLHFVPDSKAFAVLAQAVVIFYQFLLAGLYCEV